jgi:hypothetical protein
MNQFLTGSMGVMFFKFCNIKNLEIISPKKKKFQNQSNLPLKRKKRKKRKKVPMFWFLKDKKFVKETTGCQSIARIENKKIKL